MNAGTVHLEALCLFVIFIKLEGFCAKCTVLAGNRHASRFRREARREQQSGVGFNQPDACIFILSIMLSSDTLIIILLLDSFMYKIPTHVINDTRMFTIWSYI